MSGRRGCHVQVSVEVPQLIERDYVLSLLHNMAALIVLVMLMKWQDVITRSHALVIVWFYFVALDGLIDFSPPQS